MAARYEISLRVLKNIFQHKSNFVSPGNQIPNHFTFAAKGAIYYVTIATVIFSHAKITCYFHVRRYHVFARDITWYSIVVSVVLISDQALHFSVFHTQILQFRPDRTPSIRTVQTLSCPNCPAHIWRLSQLLKFQLCVDLCVGKELGMNRMPPMTCWEKQPLSDSKFHACLK